MARERKPIPRPVVDGLLYQADHTCCICANRNVDVQIHHIEPSKKNESDNLIPLCPNCHSMVERKGGHGRKYSAGELKKLRDSWFANVRERRLRAVAAKHKTDFTALAAFEARRLAYEMELQPRINSDWSKIQTCLIRLIPLARDFRYEVRSEVMSAAYEVAERTRDGLPHEVAHTLGAVLAEILPLQFGGLRAPARRKITKEDKDLVERVANAAFSICYDACRYLRDLKVLEEGAQVFYMALRYAHLNKLRETERAIANEIQQCLESCEETIRGRSFQEGKQVLMHFYEEALREE